MSSSDLKAMVHVSPMARPCPCCWELEVARPPYSTSRVDEDDEEGRAVRLCRQRGQGLPGPPADTTSHMRGGGALLPVGVVVVRRGCRSRHHVSL